jgi:thiol peroxidase
MQRRLDKPFHSLLIKYNSGQITFGENEMVAVRTDVFKLGDKFVTLLGDEVKVGDAAPEFTSVVPGWGTVNPLQESKGKVIILSAVPSLDTDTCDRETRRFNEEAAKLSEDIVIYTISCDFPMAQKRWCGT